MTNEKKDLFVALGLAADESISNESVYNPKSEDEMTALESLDAKIAILEEIDKSFEETEEASMESVKAELETLTNAIIYKDLKYTGDTSEAYFESLSNEFGVSVEGIKDIAASGYDAIKTILSKMLEAFKKMLGFGRTEKKILSTTEAKLKRVKDLDAAGSKVDPKKLAKVIGVSVLLSVAFSEKTGSDQFNNVAELADYFHAYPQYNEIVTYAIKVGYDHHVLAFDDGMNAVKHPAYDSNGKLIEAVKEIEAMANKVTKSTDENFGTGRAILGLIKLMRKSDAEGTINLNIKIITKKLDPKSSKVGNLTKDDITAFKAEKEKLETLNSIRKSNIADFVSLAKPVMGYKGKSA